MALHANKAELLMVLDRPEIPLNTDGSENDIRCQVTRRKVSAGTRSDIGRDRHDAFLSLAKACDKLGVAFWDYPGIRLRVARHVAIGPLDDYVRSRSLTPDRRSAPHFAPVFLKRGLGSRLNTTGGLRASRRGHRHRRGDAP
jgi:hypothetical protein